MDDKVTEPLLARIADKVYPQEGHLEKFATTLLQFDHVKFYHIIGDAGRDSWRRCFYLLRAWNNQDKRKIRDLCQLLQDAERLGFVQQGTRDDLVNGKVWDLSYLQKCQVGQYPDFASMVAPWYTDPIWQNMLLFPWMDEEALLLSEAHAAMEMVSIVGRYRMRRAEPLKDYRDLFANLQKEGTRILVKGDPGTGKTTFVHKVAFDSATGKLDLFDVVFVIKLKFASKDQSIAQMIKEQIKSIWEDDSVSDTLIQQYIKSGTNRVLLVLDGIDEITLKEFPQVLEVLKGQAYRKCCILATTRPYVAETLNNKMTLVANITGFSREKAEEFIAHMLIEADERKRFFHQLETKNMTEMYRIPMLVQALALLFREDEELPATYTMTYDQLVFFLRKTCEDSKELSEDELKAAMEEVSELAFRGLTREDKQLVFSRDEVRNKDSFKLGILTAEKGGSGFNPTTVLQFLHKTFQEYSVADYVVDGLENDDREPWETIKQLFGKELKDESIVLGNQAPGSQESRTTDEIQDDQEGPNVDSIENNNKDLLRFIVGKLFKKCRDGKASDDFVLSVMIEIANLLVELYCGKDENKIPPVELLCRFMEELMRESDKPDLQSPVLEHLCDRYNKITFSMQTSQR